MPTLAQMQSNRLAYDKRFKHKKNFKKKFNGEMNGKRKNRMQPRKSWRNIGPGKGDKPDCHEGDTPIIKMTVKGREYEWCAKCNHGQGKWTTTHNAADHWKDFNKENAKGRFNKGEANVSIGRMSRSTCKKFCTAQVRRQPTSVNQKVWTSTCPDKTVSALIS